MNIQGNWYWSPFCRQEKWGSEFSDLPKCGSHNLKHSLWGSKAMCAFCATLLHCQWKMRSSQDDTSVLLRQSTEVQRSTVTQSYYALGNKLHFVSKQSLGHTVMQPGHPARWPEEHSYTWIVTLSGGSPLLSVGRSALGIRTITLRKSFEDLWEVVPKKQKLEKSLTDCLESWWGRRAVSFSSVAYSRPLRRLQVTPKMGPVTSKWPLCWSLKTRDFHLRFRHVLQGDPQTLGNCMWNSMGFA